MIEVIQINLHRSETATLALMKLINSELSTSNARVLRQGNGNRYLASVYLPTLPPTSELQKLILISTQALGINIANRNVAQGRFLDITDLGTMDTSMGFGVGWTHHRLD
ncbi:uncharacterized protein LOC131805660 isoform X2 [Musca domestica]|uniref:Uncharacterized protein LOC131805660 isoform X2 n=1 Tax=Musca domestica TaxID=7370 RepID=A0ABM3VH43_MUSDO|nr:uncharacterized protein LOC131805660 isoform X2 [Musca domestica]